MCVMFLTCVCLLCGQTRHDHGGDDQNAYDDNDDDKPCFTPVR